MNKRAYSLLLTGCLLLFSCLLISGIQRLVAFPERQEPALFQSPQAILCSAQSSLELEREPGRPRFVRETRLADAHVQMELSQSSGTGETDANGNILCTGVSYVRAVYRAFALGDGFV